MTHFSLPLTELTIIKSHTVYVITAGRGQIVVDFKPYQFTEGDILSLAPGQSVRLTVGDVAGSGYEFTPDEVRQQANTQLLFTHIVNVAHLRLSVVSQQTPLQRIPLADLVDAWREMNPFAATTQEIELLFSVKELINEHYRQPISVASMSASLQEQPARLNTLLKRKTGCTLAQLHHQKLLLEARRGVVFSTATTKEISYNLGFSDPTYFNRFFKLHTGTTPQAFRHQHAGMAQDPFMIRLMALIDAHFSTSHPANFYADEFNLTAGTLARKVQQQTGQSLLRLIQAKRLNQARVLLQAGTAIIDVAYATGFKEPNHFSTFFKNATGQTPSRYRSNIQKVHSFA